MFYDGRWSADSVAAKMARANGVPGVLESEPLAEAALSIRSGMKAMGLAALESDFAAGP